MPMGCVDFAVSHGRSSVVVVNGRLARRLRSRSSRKNFVCVSRPDLAGEARRGGSIQNDSCSESDTSVEAPRYASSPEEKSVEDACAISLSLVAHITLRVRRLLPWGM